MKSIWITYHLFTDHSKPADDLPHKTETMENYIRVSLPDEVANDVLEKQSKSEYVEKFGRETLNDWLNLLARLQGYQKGYFVLAEEV